MAKTVKVQGRFVGCDAVPTFYDDLRKQGAAVDLSLFGASVQP